MIAVTDTGPLLVFAKLHLLHLLPGLYSSVQIPSAVYHEAIVTGTARGYPDAILLRSFLHEHGWSAHPDVAISGDLLDCRLGIGEAQAISLAAQLSAELLIDDNDARLCADELKITSLDSLGVLSRAYRLKLLSAAALVEVLTVIEERRDIWIHPSLCDRVRRSLLGR